MERTRSGILVEIVAKAKGCMLCDLAVGILEEVAEELQAGLLTWEVVDVGAREGIDRGRELAKSLGRFPAVPSIFINGNMAFDHIPDFQALTRAVHQALEVTQ